MARRLQYRKRYELLQRRKRLQTRDIQDLLQYRKRYELLQPVKTFKEDPIRAVTIPQAV